MRISTLFDHTLGKLAYLDDTIFEGRPARRDRTNALAIRSEVGAFTRQLCNLDIGFFLRSVTGLKEYSSSLSTMLDSERQTEFLRDRRSTDGYRLDLM